jgi:predicted PurR-regulated permease PerM
LALTAILGYLSFLIFKPFLYPLVWALVLSIVFYPLYALVLKGVRIRTIASLITVTVIVLTIIGPVSYFSLLLAAEANHFFESMDSGAVDALQDLMHNPRIKELTDRVASLFGVSEAEIDKTVVERVSKFGKDLFGKVTYGVGGVLSGVVDFLFMTITVFFFFRDGPEFLQKIHYYLPFSDSHKERLDRQVRDIIISTIYGGVAVALAQGVVGGMAFSLLGIRSPILWSFAVSVATFIPLFGSFAVWGPMTVYLYVTGDVAKAVILAVVGIFGISLIDYVVRPIIIGNRTKMPILVIFFSILGGLKLFGLIGLILGPLVLALFVSVVEIFRNVEGRENA